MGTTAKITITSKQGSHYIHAWRDGQPSGVAWHLVNLANVSSTAHPVAEFLRSNPSSNLCGISDYEDSDYLYLIEVADDVEQSKVTCRSNLLQRDLTRILKLECAGVPLYKFAEKQMRERCTITMVEQPMNTSGQ